MELIDGAKSFSFIKYAAYEKAFDMFRDVITEGSLSYISNEIILQRVTKYLLFGKQPYEIRLGLKLF